MENHYIFPINVECLVLTKTQHWIKHYIHIDISMLMAFIGLVHIFLAYECLV